MDLMAAAITTNTAIEFCRKLQEEFEATFPEHEGVHERGCLYCIYSRVADGEELNSINPGDTCLTPAREVLSSFTDVFKDDGPDVALVVPPEHMSLYPGESDCRTTDEDEFLEQDVGIAIGMLPEFFALIHATPRVRAEHEVFRGLRRLKMDKKQPFWLTFGFQVYMDIRHILGENVDQGFKNLCRGAQPIINSIDRLLDFHREMGAEGPADETLGHIADEITDWVENDQVCDIIDRERRLVNANMTEEMPRNYHLERDPLWCGLLLYNFRMAAHEGAILTANSWTFVIAAANLYNSLRKTGILRCEWPDMERVFAMHRAKNLFVGDLPTTSKGGMKNFGLPMGVPLGMLAKIKRKRSSDYTRSKPRRFLGMLAPTLWKFKSSICDGVGRGALGPEDIKEFMRQKVVEEIGDDCFNCAIDATTVLRLLPLAIQSETADVTFDHFEMHIVCWKLLREIDVALGGSIPGWSHVYRDDRILPGRLLLWLLSGLADREQMATNLGLGGQLVSANLSSRAGELLESLIARDGDVASKSTRDSGAFASSS
jgi:hypothetical protein